MLLPLRSGELQKLIPAVATGNQFREALGNPRKILQRILISSIGGVITLLISQSQVASQFYSLWLVVGVVFLLFILWGPIVEAGNKNAELRKYPFAALFDGRVEDIFTREKIENRQEQANKIGKLEIVENRRTWLFLEIGDEEGYLGQVYFPMEKVHQSIRRGTSIRCIVLSQSRDFKSISAITDAWLPSQRLWVGEYPYLLRPAFEELCKFRLS
ncbi:hypothetical protein [Prochlorococcus sp. MIT 1307]|uniref:hypothetical protein n=1 Tax=Prochlorococcus sp. MIT 1307 TaxID=3096219 RepID=UPI002A74EBE8|nr:hypothetical protein [Prochlorococcus sp. MIT 1307]